jgi:CubicO group peptidase (beta-lactamase class C family)
MHRRRHRLLSLILLLVVSVPVHADEIDDYLKDVLASQHIAGISIAVLKDGAIVKAQGYGLANIEHNVPVRPDTVFKIGSVSKQFLATGVMLLVQDGKIGLNDPISKYIAGTPDTWQAITIRHLLTHTSGLIREGPGFDINKVQPDIDVITTAFPLPLNFKPGDKYEYSNVGYFTLAEVIHKVSGKPWGEFLAERVFVPLGMTSTRVTTVRDIIPNRADGYDWSAETQRFQNATEIPAVRPSGVPVHSW